MRTALSVLAAAALFAVALPAAAQSLPSEFGVPAPVFSSLDERGVDLVTGVLTAPGVGVGVGDPAAGGLTWSQTFRGAVWNGAMMAGIGFSGSTATVFVGEFTEQFTYSGGVFTPVRPSGNTLALASGSYTYTASDGTVYRFAPPGGQYDFSPLGSGIGRLQTITRPDGEVITYHHHIESGTVCVPEPLYPPPYGPECAYQISYSIAWLQSITNNYGYQLHFEYAEGEYFWPKKVTAINNAVEYCAPTAAACTLSNTWPSLTLGAGGPRPASVTDQAGRTTSYTYGANGRLTGIRYPGSPADDVTIAYYTSGANNGRVNTVTVAGVTWTYSYADNGDTRTTTVQSPAGTRTIVSSLSAGRVTSVTDELGRTTSYQHDAQGRITRVTLPEGNYTQYAYDARGNVTQATQVAKPGSGLANITVSAAYPEPSATVCSNPVTCNKPASVTDARGFRTDFTYDSTHGGVLTVTSPAPSGGAPVGSGVRPQTRYTYETRQARYLNGPSSFVNGSPIYVPVTMSSCATTASCANGADETRTTIAYPTTAAANNLLPVSVTTAAGNGAVSATTSYSYDDIGNVLSIDGPLSGAADTTVFKYDNAGRLVGTIGPDPDGAGPLLHRAMRTTYDTRGLVTFTEQGTTTGQSDENFNALTRLARSGTLYDSHGRAVQSRAYNGATNTVAALIQQTYDTAGRPDCISERMNPAEFGSISPSCAPGTAGADGPDRIARPVYDAAGQVTASVSAVGTALQQNTVSTTYSPNGQTLTVTDPRGYRTTYAYDGHDRLIRVEYPHPTSTGVSSSTDYEQYTYDAAGNVATYRTRAGQTFSYAYDNLGRVKTVTAPSPDPAMATTYDLLGRTLTVTRGGQTLAYTYDALGRTLSETGPLGAVSYQYDAAGRVTRITWPDGFYVVYDYDLTGAVTAIRENGAASGAGVLATYAYDNLGRRVSVTRGGGAGAATSYAYDGLSRLSSLTHNPAGTAHDATFGLGYNPASQIVSRTRSNAVYDWQTQWAGTRSYSHNGLSQTISVSGASPAPSYDDNGNMTWDGTASYAYDHSNRMKTAGAAALAYDPAGRLYQAGTTRFLYAGSFLAAEYDAGGNVLRRYVPGPGTDEPVTWYEGAGTSDRRFLLADERGSVIAVTNGSGAVTNVNTWDEYGAPAAANVGRFQYTGQMWMPEAGLYHYKARAYNPRLGRFMQTDPIGYGDGMNLYAYAGNDPVNGVDPTGLQTASSGDNDLCGITRYTSGGCTPTPPEGIDRLIVTGQISCDMACRVAMFEQRVYAAWNSQFIQDAQALVEGLNTPGGYYCFDYWCQWDPSATAEDIREYEAARDKASIIGAAGVVTVAAGGIVAAELGVTAAVTRGVLFIARGREFSFGRNFRIAPFGNRTNHPIGRWPHYHRRAPNAQGESLPGQGIKRHRPWESSKHDQHFWDRF